LRWGGFCRRLWCRRACVGRRTRWCGLRGWPRRFDRCDRGGGFGGELVEIGVVVEGELYVQIVLRQLVSGRLGDDRSSGLGCITEAALRAENVALVRAVLDLAHDAHPVRRERVVPLDHRLELEPDAGVPNLLATKDPDASLDILLQDVRR